MARFYGPSHDGVPILIEGHPTARDIQLVIEDERGAVLRFETVENRLFQPVDWWGWPELRTVRVRREWAAPRVFYNGSSYTVRPAA